MSLLLLLRHHPVDIETGGFTSPFPLGMIGNMGMVKPRTLETVTQLGPHATSQKTYTNFTRTTTGNRRRRVLITGSKK